MMNFYYFIYMFMLFMLVFFFGLNMYYMNLGVLLEWMIMESNTLNLEFIILVDWISLLFVSFIILISSMIMIYSYSYMYNDKFKNQFIYLVVMFMLFMILMVFSPNIFSIMFGWDGLGVVSYCLVIYYQNFLSFSSGMVTILVNRVGDIGLLMSISLLMMNGSWNIWSLQESMVVSMMLLMAGVTKSAQIPFSMWLPMAMAAPTPVSALVHSSTLVTAGVYLLIRFNKFLMIEVSYFLLLMSVVTMFLSGLMANFEYDLKKIIALSTLSQLGLMMMLLSLGLDKVVFFHLLTHAVFKSMLFMSAGVIIHSLMSIQDIRMMGGLRDMLPFIMMSFMISSLSLSGFPFLAGFYSKDYIMELLYSLEINIYLMWFILMSLMFTVMYSIRLNYYVFFFSMNFGNLNSLQEDKIMSMSMKILIILSVSVGSLLNWMFFFDCYELILKSNIKSLSFTMCFLGLLMSMMTLKLMKFIYYFYIYMNSSLFLSYLYSGIYLPFFWSSKKIMVMDKMWMEFMLKNFIKFIMKYVMINFYQMNLMMLGFIYLMMFMLIFL